MPMGGDNQKWSEAGAGVDVPTVGVGIGVALGSDVGVADGVGVEVAVGVAVGVAVAVAVGVLVAVGVGVKVGVPSGAGGSPEGVPAAAIRATKATSRARAARACSPEVPGPVWWFAALLSGAELSLVIGSRFGITMRNKHGRRVLDGRGPESGIRSRRASCCGVRNWQQETLPTTGTSSGG
jgi:hypothetical protein